MSAIIGTYRFTYGKKGSKQVSDFKIYGYDIKDTGDLPPFVKVYGQYASVRVCGVNLPAVKSVYVKLYGHWENHPKYGPSFFVKTYEYITPTTTHGLISLFSSKEFPKIGKKTAEKLVEAFGMKVIEVIENEPEKLYDVLKKEHADIIISNYKRVQHFVRLVRFLSPYNITPAQCDIAYELFGSDAIDMIKRNPYVLMRVRLIGFGTCEAIARTLNIALDSEIRIKGAVIQTLREKIAQTGDTYVPVSEIRTRSMEILNSGFDPAPVSDELWNRTCIKMHDTREIAVQINKNDPSDKAQFVFPTVYYEAEYWTAQKILCQMTLGLSNLAKQAFSEALEHYSDANSIDLHPVQKEAVMRSLSNRVSIITGGPGTGKTTIISAIIACYKAVYGKEVLLLAPTGKAARRMTESTGESAFTIHSRLGLYDIENQSSKSINPIDEGLVIVDECSMVDNLLMRHLMDAISLKSTHIVFVGDIDQLPSVGAGAVLRELIGSAVIPTTRLTKIFRQAGDSQTIVDNSQKINRGDQNLVYDDVFQFENAESDTEAAEKIVKLYLDEVKKYGLAEVALLCPRRQSKDGKYICVADEMNKLIQNVINPAAGGKAEAKVNKQVFRLGDRVMQWQNLPFACNGDVGVITDVSSRDDEPIIHVSWENGNESDLNSEDMKSITLAYAMTIHKSQGSEYSSVIIPILKEHDCGQFRRNLLYTGVSRAKKKVTLVGDVETISRCIKAVDTTVRKTLLGARLQYNAPSILADFREESDSTVSVKVLHVDEETGVVTMCSGPDAEAINAAENVAEEQVDTTEEEPVNESIKPAEKYASVSLFEFFA